ncbi:helix-turn-helix transcriptional regulator [[Clostridium] hylemonae]|uniref:helix-turn-helix transcriptional regulator n=1 Tax=[Clostridium] hylemonae TaxID=89153 RepID=UPI00110740DE|nr:YafY family protein [[Clostridium] hylemonae]
MKIDRLIGILSVLLQQEKVTAPYLADKFEVSRRTVNRDIEDLCKAGIPLVTTQGSGGGISIMEGYKLEKTLLTSAEMQAILTGLKSLDSVAGTSRYRQLMEKLDVRSTTLASNSHILIDLSSYYKTTLAPKIEMIQDAIENRRYITFHYYAPKGESVRKIEPCLLVFQWSSWYVRGYCTDREDHRLFKLNRMLELKVLPEQFPKREEEPYELDADSAYDRQIPVKAVFVPEMRWRLIEEYGADSFTELEDGRLLFQFDFADEENIFSWILSFADKVELLEPARLRIRLLNIAEGIRSKYKDRQ